MLYSAFITKCRRFVQDFSILTQDTFDGDAATKNFRTNHRPILEGSYTIKVDNITKTETTDYTINLDTGVIAFVSTPASGSDNVIIEYEYCIARDTEWLDIINSVLSDLREKIWIDANDETTFDIVKDQDDYGLNSISADIFAVIDVWYKKSSEADWKSVTRDTNVKYFKEQNVLNLRPSFSSSDYDLRIRYLEAYALGSATTSTFEPVTKFHEMIKYFCGAEYVERFIMLKIKEMGAMTKEPSYESMAEIRNYSSHLRKIAELKLARVKSEYPPIAVQTIREGIKS